MDSHIGMESDRNENLKKNPPSLSQAFSTKASALSLSGGYPAPTEMTTPPNSHPHTKKTHLLEQADSCNNLSLGGGGGGGGKNKKNNKISSETQSWLKVPRSAGAGKRDGRNQCRVKGLWNLDTVSSLPQSEQNTQGRNDCLTGHTSNIQRALL